MGLKMRSSLPVRIVAFRSEKEFGPYRIRESSAAFYLSGHDRDYIVMSKVSSDARSVAVHEYVHLLVNHSGVSLPTWFNEGLATLYSTLTPLAGKIKVGDILPAYYQLLHRKKLLGLETLTSVDRDSPHYNERDRAGVFYAQSWALTHMLLLSEQYRLGVGRFTVEIQNGARAETAFQQVYGKSFEQVEKDFQSYISGDRFFAGFFDTKLEKSAEKPDARPASKLESGIVLANLLAMTRKTERAREMYEQLSAESPGAFQVPEALGYLAWRENNVAEAVHYFARAVKLGSSNPKMHYDYALLLRGQGEEPSAVASLLLAAVNLRPDYEEARSALGFALVDDGRYEDAVIQFARVKSIAPERASRVYQAVAYANLRLNRMDQAQKTIRLARKYAQGADELDAAERLSAWIQRVASGELSSQPRAPGFDAEQDGPPRLTRQQPRPAGDPRGNNVESPLCEGCAPISERSDVQKVTGILRRVDCLSMTARFHVASGDETVKLYVDKPREITLKNAPPGEFELRCGMQEELRVTVEYMPRQDDQRETVGDVVAVDFR